jgi:hypothetical protein
MNAERAVVLRSGLATARRSLPDGLLRREHPPLPVLLHGGTCYPAPRIPTAGGVRRTDIRVGVRLIYSRGEIVEQISETSRLSGGSERSTGELIKLMSEQASTLVRDELKLAQLEMTHKGKQAGIGAGMMGGGGVIALYGLGCLIACAILAISRVLAPWLSALIVGAALLAAAGIVALTGRARLRQATPPVPADAAQSVKADVDEIKERTHR